jgi:hypothetical protein
MPTCAFRTLAPWASSAFFQNWAVSCTLNGMDVIRLIAGIFIGWIRDIAVGISGRAAEESLRAHIKRCRKRKRRRRTK